MVMLVEKINYNTKCDITRTMEAIKDIKSIHPMKHPDDLRDASDDLLRAALQFEQLARQYGVK